MKKEHLIIIAAGVILLLILAKKQKTPILLKVIKPGDKGNEVYGLQNALISITGVRLGNMGVYDNETMTAVQYYMKDCSSLQDYEKGWVDKTFAKDLFLIADKLKK
jgi:hypothetical protein